MFSLGLVCFGFGFGFGFDFGFGFGYSFGYCFIFDFGLVNLIIYEFGCSKVELSLNE